MVTRGLCECGCGQPTNISKRTDSKRGAVKGQPQRFISGHYLRPENTVSPYKQTYRRGHNGKNGTILEHQLIAMSALGGRALPAGADVHHVDGNPRNNSRSNLVICQSRGYHKRLHFRARVLAAGGDPNTEKVCGICKRPKPLDQFYRSKAHKSTGRGNRCIPCANEAYREWSRSRRQSTAA